MTTEQFNNLADRIIKNHNWFNDFIELCKEFYKTNGAGGCLHIVLDDGNLYQGNIQFCYGWACGINDENAKNIASLMTLMNMKQRQKIYNNYSLYKQ